MWLAAKRVRCHSEELERLEGPISVIYGMKSPSTHVIVDALAPWRRPGVVSKSVMNSEIDNNAVSFLNVTAIVSNGHIIHQYLKRKDESTWLYGCNS